MKQYQNLITHILENGYATDDRTGTGTTAVFGTQLRFDLQKGFPALTTKKLAWNACISELLWFMSGSTNVEELRERTHGVNSDKMTIWDDNYNNQAKALGYDNGYLGPVYGSQWRNFGGAGSRDGVDQLVKTIYRIKAIPSDRRQIVSAWNPSDLDAMALPPCHLLYQFNVRNGFLDLQWYQRSVDVFLGLPFNIASYAALVHIVAKMCNLKPGELVFTGGNTHIYSNHIEQCQEILRREPKELCQLEIKNIPGDFYKHDTVNQLEYIISMKSSDFVLTNYDSHPPIKGKMAV